MTQKLIECLTWGFCAGLLGVVYRHILAKEDAFNAWFRFGARYEGKWFFKPVWGCAFCFAGQVALWSYFLLRILPAMITAVRLNGPFYLHSWHCAETGATALFCLIIVCAVAIFTAKVISWLFMKNEI